MVVNCAVCEAEIRSTEAFATLRDDEEVYYLCSSRCLDELEQNPELYTPWVEEEEPVER